MKLSKTLFLLTLLFTASLLGSNAAFAIGEKTTIRSSNDLAHLINIAGKQRMLSQRIAKSYFYYRQGIRPEKTRTQLLDSIKEFDANFNMLQSKISLQGVQDMLVFIGMAKGELATLTKAPYNKDNASLVLDYSETLLEGSRDIVKRLEASSKLKKESIIEVSGRQRMLSQRIAKYYIAYQAGFRDHNTVVQLKTAVSEFEESHATLRGAKRNTPEIKTKLVKVEKLWNIVAKFYNDVERGGLPVIVLATCDDITASMNQVTGMYVGAVGSHAVVSK